MLSGVFLMLSEQTNGFSSTTGGVKLTLAHSLTQIDVFYSVLDQQCQTRGLWPRTGHQLKEPLLWNWFSSFLIIFSNPDSGFYLFKWPASATPLKLISLFTLHYLPHWHSYYYFSQLQTCFRFLYCCFYFNWMIYCLLPSRQLGYAPVPPWSWTG